jgi:hypothetical protein
MSNDAERRTKRWGPSPFELQARHLGSTLRAHRRMTSTCIEILDNAIVFRPMRKDKINLNVDSLVSHAHSGEIA